MRDFSQREYALMLFSVAASFSIIQLMSIHLSGNIPYFTGYTAGIDIQRVFITSTGHIYQGQWNNLATSQQVKLGWGTNFLSGTSSSLGLELFLSMFQMIMGVSFTQTFFLLVIPIGIPILFPFLALGLYRMISAEKFRRNVGILIFSFTCFFSFLFYPQLFDGGFGMQYFFYIVAVMLIFAGWRSFRRADFAVFLIIIFGLGITYHTLADYTAALFVILLFLQLIVAKLKPNTAGWDLKLNWIIVGVEVLIFLSSYVLITSVFDFKFLLSGYLLESFSNIGILPNAQTSLTSGTFSYFDIGAEVLTAMIFVIAFFIGVQAILNGDRKASHLLFLTAGLLLLAVGMLLGLGPAKAIEGGRIYQAVFPFAPLILTSCLVYSSKTIRKIVIAVALLNLIIVVLGTMIYPVQSFGIISNTLPSSYIVQVDFTGKFAPLTSSIFTNFLIAEPLLYSGHPNLFGLSQYQFSNQKFIFLSHTMFGNGTGSAITSALANLTGEPSTIVLFQSSEGKQIPMESGPFIPYNTTFVRTYEQSFDIIYSTGNTEIFFT